MKLVEGWTHTGGLLDTSMIICLLLNVSFNLKNKDKLQTKSLKQNLLTAQKLKKQQMKLIISYDKTTF